MKRERKKMGIALLMFMTMLLIAGCGKGQESVSLGPAQGESDSAYIQSKGVLVAGITDFAPMDYREGEKWIGFDAELAEAFAESIGVTLELKEIEWDDKVRLLENGEIDCIWNGMTMTPALQESISCSEPYLSNAQVIVMHRDNLERYQSIEACQHLLFAVEAGSTGEDLLKEMKCHYTTFATQKDALQGVLDKKADAAVVDVIMAASNSGDGQDDNKLEIAFSMNDEKICVGFRRESDLTADANTFIREAYEDGTIKMIAEKYGIKDAVLE